MIMTRRLSRDRADWEKRNRTYRPNSARAAAPLCAPRDGLFTLKGYKARVRERTRSRRPSPGAPKIALAR